MYMLSYINHVIDLSIEYVIPIHILISFHLVNEWAINRYGDRISHMAECTDDRNVCGLQI